MKAKKLFLPLLLCPLFLGSDNVRSTEVGCDLSTAKCLQMYFERECRTPTATMESCLEFARNAEHQASSDSVEWRLITAAAYNALTDLSVTTDQRTDFANQERSIYEKILLEDKTNAQAYLGLSNIANNEEERIRLLRKAAEYDSKNKNILRPYAMALQVAGNLEQAIGVYLQAYSSTELNRQKWEFASRAYSIAKEINDEKMTDEIINRVSVDAGLVRITNSTWLAEPIDINGVRVTLLASCYDSVIYIVSSDYCLRGLEDVYSKLTIDSSLEFSQSDELVKLYANAVIYAERSEYLAEQYPEWRDQTVRKIEKLLEEQRFHNPVLFDTYASITEDLAKRMWALESAARLAPQNGAAQYRLGLAYLEHAKYKEAVSQFKLARTLLPEWRHEVLDQNLLAAEQGAKVQDNKN